MFKSRVEGLEIISSYPDSGNAMVFYLNKDGVLYKRNFDWVLL